MGEPAELTYEAPRVRGAFARLLDHEAGGEGASAEDLAAASGRLLDRLSQQLSGIIGRAGVEALLLRAVKLKKAEFPLLDERMFSGGDRAGGGLQACLREHEAEVIKEVSVTVFTTFAGLLMAVIGERLAWSLLRGAWPEAVRPDIELEEAPE